MAANLDWLDGAKQWLTSTNSGTIFGVVVGVLAWYGLATVFPENLMPFPLEVLGLSWELVASGTA